MWSHAAKTNYDRMQERIERDKKKDEVKKEEERKDPVLSNGKRQSECTTEELIAAMSM